jgi:hypothetical protein
MAVRVGHQPGVIEPGRAELRSAREYQRGLVLVLAAAVLLVVIDVWWLIADRRGFPLDIDEAGYMTIALNDHAALSQGGLSAYWHAVESQYPYAPLVPALTAFVYLVRASILASYTTELAFFLVLALACYGVAARLLGPRLGALASLVILTAPGVTGFAREYLFALPSATLLICAVYALLRSDGLRSRRWAALLGISLGLLLLARTMSIAIVPAVLLAAMVRILTSERGSRVHRALNLGAAVGLAALIAGVWYLPNLSPVFHYLTQYGYGAQSGAYGSRHPLLSWAWWTRELHTLLAEDLFLPLGLLALVGVAASILTAVRSILGSHDRGAALRRLARADATAVAIVLAGGYLALSSSPNRGTGFALMLMPLLIILAALPLRRVPRALPVVAGVLGVVMLANVLAASDVSHGLSQPRIADVPALGAVPVLDGEGNTLAAIRRQLPGDTTHFAASERAWPRAVNRGAAFLLSYAHTQGRQPVVAFGMSNRLFNTNTVSLAARLYYGAVIPMAQLDPRVGGDTASAYARYLSEPQHGQPNFLLTTSSTTGDFPPTINQAQVVAAARADGFRPVRTTTLPDGRRITFWWLLRGPS